MKKYLELTGFSLRGKSTIMIAPLPVAVGSTKWRAETTRLNCCPADRSRRRFHELDRPTRRHLHARAASSLGSKLAAARRRLRLVFRGIHSVYVALRTALDLKIINFKEFLDTLARVYDSYLSYPDDQSLIDASERRWTTPGSFVYDKGMLVAFLYDLLLRNRIWWYEHARWISIESFSAVPRLTVGTGMKL